MTYIKLSFKKSLEGRCDLEQKQRGLFCGVPSKPYAQKKVKEKEYINLLLFLNTIAVIFAPLAVFDDRALD